MFQLTGIQNLVELISPKAISSYWTVRDLRYPMGFVIKKNHQHLIFILFLFYFFYIATKKYKWVNLFGLIDQFTNTIQYNKIQYTRLKLGCILHFYFPPKAGKYINGVVCQSVSQSVSVSVPKNYEGSQKLSVENSENSEIFSNLDT
jgi:hypothetical protein